MQQKPKSMVSVAKQVKMNKKCVLEHENNHFCIQMRFWSLLHKLKNHDLNMNAQLSSGARIVIFWMELILTSQLNACGKGCTLSKFTMSSEPSPLPYAVNQGSHKLWKTWKIKKKSSLHGTIMEFEKYLNNHGEITEIL